MKPGDIFANETGNLYIILDTTETRVVYRNLLSDKEQYDMFPTFNWQLKMNFFYMINDEERERSSFINLFELERDYE
jgi:hypothetical protein